MKQLGFTVAALVLMLVATLAVAEGLVWWLNPQPRVQLITPDRAETLEARDGTAVWTVRHADFTARGCAEAPPSATRIGFVGSSIFFGSGVDGPEVFSSLLAAAHDPAELCVDNLATPAFTAPQKRVTALELLSQEPPLDRLYWEVWKNDPGAWSFIGGAAVNLTYYPRDALGYPNPWDLPPRLNQALYEALLSYRYAVLALGADPRHDVAEHWDQVFAEEVPPVLAKAEAVGTEVVFVTTPSLNVDFAVSAARPFKGYAKLAPLAAAHGNRTLVLAEHLVGEAVEALRVDTCCHYSPAGHARLAQIFTEDLAQHPPARPTGAPSAAEGPPPGDTPRLSAPTDPRPTP